MAQASKVCKLTLEMNIWAAGFSLSLLTVADLNFGNNKEGKGGCAFRPALKWRRTNVNNRFTKARVTTANDRTSKMMVAEMEKKKKSQKSREVGAQTGKKRSFQREAFAIIPCVEITPVKWEQDTFRLTSVHILKVIIWS